MIKKSLQVRRKYNRSLLLANGLIPISRHCTKCGKHKPAAAFGIDTNRFGKIVLRSWCRRCCRGYIRNRHKTNPRKYHAGRIYYRLVAHSRKGTPADYKYFNRKRLFKILKNVRYCESCGREMAFHKHLRDDSFSVDKVIPRLGYVRGNIGFICYRCNRLKNDATQKELRHLYLYVKKKRRQLASDLAVPQRLKQNLRRGR